MAGPTNNVSQRKFKDMVEGIFAKDSKRLPVFSIITIANSDNTKKSYKKQNKRKGSKVGGAEC